MPKHVYERDVSPMATRMIKTCTAVLVWNWDVGGARQAGDACALTGLRHAAGGPPQALIAQVYGYSVDLRIASGVRACSCQSKCNRTHTYQRRES